MTGLEQSAVGTLLWLAFAALFDAGQYDVAGPRFVIGFVLFAAEASMTEHQED